MSNVVISTARNLAAEIRAQEDNLDATLAGQARLVGALLDARRSAKVPASVGNVALDRAFEAITHGRELRKSMLAIHAELAQMDLREIAVGDVSDCPKLDLNGPTLVVAREAHAA